MDGWDIGLLAVAGYIAVASLVQLMLRRRRQLYEQYRRQAEAEAEAQRRRSSAQPEKQRRSA